MANKMLRMAALYFILFISLNAYSAPVLKMHVFDEVANQHQPMIQMHIFNANNKLTQKNKTKYLSQKTSSKTKLAYEKANVYLRTGYRQDELFWNKAGLNDSPNILSELTWDDLKIATIETGVSLAVHPKWLLNADFTYGRIFSGENQDSDYNGDNRTLEFSRSNNGADEGDVYDLSISAAYRLPISTALEIQPEFGISYHAQNLKIVDGNQTISAYGNTFPLGPFSGLNSTYDSTWFGPWSGVSALFKPTSKTAFNVGIKYHYIDYDSTADWNLRSDRAHPESFAMKADGYGFVYFLEGQYRHSKEFSIDASLKYQDWRADKKGQQTIYWADGTTTKLRFNEVEWESFGFSLGFNYDF